MSEEGSAADFAMDYDKLYAMQRGLHALAEKADTGGGTGVWEEVGSETLSANEELFGVYDVAYQFQIFYGKSKVRIKEGKDKLKQFGDMFGGVADALYEQDAQIATTAATTAANSLFDNWKQEKLAVEAWEERNDEWNAYLKEIGADEYFREHPDADIWEVCSVTAEDSPAFCETWRDDYGEDRPAPPGERPDGPDDEFPPSHIQFGDDDGGTTDVWLYYDEDYNVIEEKATVVTPDGEEFTITTEYDGPPDYSEPDENGNSYDKRDYTVTTTGPDGTETVEEVKVNDDGSGTTSESTSTFTNDDDEEETETTESETTYNEDGGQTTTSTTTDADGNTETTETEIVHNDDGTQDRTITTTDKDGNVDWTTYHRDDGTDTWEETDSGGDTGTSNEEGADGADGDNNGPDYPSDSWTGPKV
jgi:hypothetical protein